MEAANKAKLNDRYYLKKVDNQHKNVDNYEL